MSDISSLIKQLQCRNCAEVWFGQDGQDGQDGEDGQDGQDGQDGLNDYDNVDDCKDGGCTKKEIEECGQ